MTVTDVTLRDGLQSLADTYPTATKRAIYDALVMAGCRSIEITSFMRLDRLPQLADADVFAASLPSGDGVERRALIANPKGLERAIAAGVDVCAVLVTLSDAYCRRNQGSDTQRNIELAIETITRAKAAGMRTDVSFSMPIFCPYEGSIAPERLEKAAARLIDAGVDAFTLCTSSGLESPREVSERLSILRQLSDRPLALHLHDTNGMAMAVVMAGLAAGITRYECAMGGIGGGIALPSGMPGHGNLPTEDFVHLMAEMNIDTGIEVEAAVAAACETGRLLGLPPASRATAGATKNAVLKAARH